MIKECFLHSLQLQCMYFLLLKVLIMEKRSQLIYLLIIFHCVKTLFSHFLRFKCCNLFLLYKKNENKKCFIITAVVEKIKNEQQFNSLFNYIYNKVHLRESAAIKLFNDLALLTETIFFLFC